MRIRTLVKLFAVDRGFYIRMMLIFLESLGEDVKSTHESNLP